MLKNGCVFLLLGTESCSKLSILIGAKWTRHKEGWLSTNLQIIFWQVSTSHFIFWINRIINKCGLWVITDPPSVIARVQWKQCFCRYSKLPCLERNTRVNFSFIKNGKGLLLYSFKANVLTNWHMRKLAYANFKTTYVQLSGFESLNLFMSFSHTFFLIFPDKRVWGT